MTYHIDSEMSSVLIVVLGGRESCRLKRVCDMESGGVEATVVLDTVLEISHVAIATPFEGVDFDRSGMAKASNLFID